MILRAILLVLLAVILLILFTRAGVQFRYDRGDLALDVCFGPIRKKLFPGEEKPKEPEKEEKPKIKRGKPKKEPSEEKKQKEEQPKAKINREQILHTVEKLPPILSRALKGTKRRIRIQPLKIHLLVAGYDPADAAVLYGKLEAALSAGLPVLRRAVRIKDEDIRLFLDFSWERMDCIAEVGVSIRPWDLLAIGLRAGVSLLKWFLGFRKLASPPPAKKAAQTKQDAGEAA